MLKRRTSSPREFNRILFWEPCLSPHKADFLEEFSKINPHLEVICCADQDLPEDRKNMGWTVPTPKHYRNIVAPDDHLISEISSHNPLTTLHIFSGIRWIPTLVKGMVAARSHNSQYMIMSEPREKNGISGKLRLLQSWITEGYHRRNAAAILAIGRNGPPWFKAAGYSASKIIPFAYFLPPSSIAPTVSNNLGKLRIGFLGRLVKMKGVYDIVDSVKLLGENASIHIAGSGPEEEALKIRCRAEGIESKFYGILAISEIGNFFSNIDVLVLASTNKDGWGAVVSEALMAGVPVIATPMVGASILLKNNIFGRCVISGSSTAIRDAVFDLKNTGNLAFDVRHTRAETAKQILSANAGALYLTEVVSWIEGKTKRPQNFYSKVDV